MRDCHPIPPLISFASTLPLQGRISAPPHSRGAKRPGCAGILRLENQRAQGIPGARCARSLVGRKKQPHQHSHHGHTGFTRHSPRNGFNSLFRALPGDRAFLSPSLKRKLSQKLDTSVEVSGPHAFAVRRSRSRQLRACVHRIQPRVRDVRETPLCGVDGMSITQRFDVVKQNSEIQKDDRNAFFIKFFTNVVIPRACGVSSTPRLLDSIADASGILDRPPARAMTIQPCFGIWAMACIAAI